MAYVSQESICKTLITDANKCVKRKEYEQAEKLYIEAVQRLENATGPQHPRIASVLIRLGDIYHNQRRLDDAEREFRRAMAIYEFVFGSDNLDVAICLQHLADVLEAKGLTEESVQIRERGKKILSERLTNFGFDTGRRGH